MPRQRVHAEGTRWGDPVSLLTWAPSAGSHADDEDQDHNVDQAGRTVGGQIIDSSHASSGVMAIADFGPDLDEPASAARSIA